MIAIWPVGPPKLMKPSFTQKRTASRKGTPCVGVLGSARSATPVSVSRLDEQLDGGVLHLEQRRGRTDRVLQPVDQVVRLEAEEIHRHLARDQPHAHVLRHLEQLGW